MPHSHPKSSSTLPQPLLPTQPYLPFTPGSPEGDSGGQNDHSKVRNQMEMGTNYCDPEQRFKWCGRERRLSSFAEDMSSISSTHMVAHNRLTPDPGYLASSSDFYIRHAYSAHRHLQVKHTYKIKMNKFFLKRNQEAPWFQNSHQCRICQRISKNPWDGL